MAVNTSVTPPCFAPMTTVPTPSTRSTNDRRTLTSPMSHSGSASNRGRLPKRMTSITRASVTSSAPHIHADRARAMRRSPNASDAAPKSAPIGPKPRSGKKKTNGKSKKTAAKPSFGTSIHRLGRIAAISDSPASSAKAFVIRNRVWQAHVVRLHGHPRAQCRPRPPSPVPTLFLSRARRRRQPQGRWLYRSPPRDFR